MVLHLPMWPDNPIFMCEDSFKNAFLKDIIVGVAQASPARSRGLGGRTGSAESRKV